ncbi:MAG TPA: bacterioferritin [Candidatus Kapabacteria bacterium]|nr:bacterioferritin [Candidatus Kapabacteria bacterium]
MKPLDPRVIDALSEVLKGELTAISQYFLHSEMCSNWGFKKLGGYMRKESIDEMKHAEVLMERILFLEGTPNMNEFFKIRIGTTVEKMMQNDLQLELEAIPRLQRGIQICQEVGDTGTRELFEHILVNEEEHVDWLEMQLELINQVGIQNYLAAQINGEDGH